MFGVGVCVAVFYGVIVQRRLVVMGHIERDEDGLSTCMGVAGVFLAVSACCHGRCVRAHDAGICR